MKETNKGFNTAELAQDQPNIYFKEWRKHTAKIVLHNLLEGKQHIIRKTEYYTFEGHFLEPNTLEIKPGIICKFWFSKQCFDKAIIRHINFKCLPRDKRTIKIAFNPHRKTKRYLVMRDITVNIT